MVSSLAVAPSLARTWIAGNNTTLAFTGHLRRFGAAKAFHCENSIPA
jgi:hypothetical protein